MVRKKMFDCVEMKHRGAEKVQAVIQGMTRDQELEFWRAGTTALREEQRRLLEKLGQTRVT
ncbi:MAG: hypothetical protein GHCLOJNM_04293 [bacterium]|nr:hypothetical protein [bacterium]